MEPLETSMKSLDEMTLEELDLEKRRLEVKAMRVDRTQKIWLWPVTNITGIVTIGTLLWNGLFHPIQEEKKKTEAAQIEKKEETKAKINAQNDEKKIRQVATLGLNSLLESNSLPPEKKLQVAAIKADIKAPSNTKIESVPQTQLSSLVSQMLDGDVSVSKKAFDLLRGPHSEDEGLTELVIQSLKAKIQELGPHNLINVVDLMMYVPRYRLTPFLSQVDNMRIEIKSRSANIKGATLNQITRLSYDLNLLNDRIARIRSTGKG